MSKYTLIAIHCPIILNAIFGNHTQIIYLNRIRSGVFETIKDSWGVWQLPPFKIVNSIKAIATISDM